jgi:Carboxypeptidase regulatory-like domain
MKTRRSTGPGLTAVCLTAVLMHAARLRAQSGTSSALAGTVTDSSGAVLSNATVTAVDVNTKATRNGQTNADGRFLFSQVNPGTYQVTVTATGFAPQNSQPTPVGVGRTETLNFSL